MLLEVEGKGIFVIKWRKFGNISTIIWEIENVPSELGDLVKELSRQKLKVPPGFFYPLS